MSDVEPEYELDYEPEVDPETGDYRPEEWRIHPDTYGLPNPAPDAADLSMEGVVP